MKRGRPRKFKNRDIVIHNQTEQTYVVVDHQLRGTKAEYKVIPLNGQKQRYGRASWVESNWLDPTGMKSSAGSMVTYRSNKFLEQEVGRGCDCQCCIHAAMPRRDFNHITGEMFDD